MRYLSNILAAAVGGRQNAHPVTVRGRHRAVTNLDSAPANGDRRRAIDCARAMPAAIAPAGDVDPGMVNVPAARPAGRAASLRITPDGRDAMRRVESSAAGGKPVVLTVQLRPDATAGDIAKAIDALTVLPGAQTVTVSAV